jgi:O-antigen/teichoic acid export membrane protein
LITILKRKLGKDADIKEVIIGTGVSLFMKICGVGSGYVFFFVMGKYYGAKGIGMYSIFMSTLTLLGLFSVAGMGMSILRYIGEFTGNGEPEKIRELYRHVLGIVIPLSFVVAVLVYIFHEEVAIYAFKNQKLAPVFKLLAFALPLFALNTVNIEFIRGLKQLKLSELLRNVFRPTVNTILLVVALLFASNIYLPIQVTIITLLLALGISFYYLFRRFALLPVKIKEVGKHFTKKELFYVSIPMMYVSFGSVLMGNVSTLLMGMYRSTEEVGIYAVAFKIATATSFILASVNTIIAPKFAELFWAKKMEQFVNLVAFSTKIIFFVSLPVLIVIALFPAFLLTLFGAEFSSGTTALLILAVGQFVNSATGSVGILMSMTGRQKVVRNIVLWMTLISVALNFMLIPKYGIAGAALATTVGIALQNIMMVLYVRRNMGINTFYWPVGRR